MTEKLYTHFDPQYNFSEADYIIIGSGIGGLTTAIFLAKAGKKVVVLERHYVPGGFSHTFKRKDGFVWDVGVHYVGNMNKNSPLRTLSNYLSDNKLKWENIGSVYDKVIFGEDEYFFISGKDNLKDQLYSYFPKDKDTIDNYFKLVKKVSRKSNLFFIQKVFPFFLKHTLGRIFRKSFREYSSKTTYQVLSKLTDNEKLINVLCAQCGDYGLPPKESSFAAHALVVNHFIEGAYYPVGGADKIYKNMIRVLNKNGGRVFVRAEVNDIIVEKNKVQGITVNDIFIACKNVISNAGVNNTFKYLLNKNLNNTWADQIKKIKPSHAHLCLYLGLDRSDIDLKLPKNNVWYYERYIIDEILDTAMYNENEKLQFAYISFPSAKDPSWKVHHKNISTIQAIGVANINWFKEFEDKPWMKRGKDYESIKDRFKQKMLTKIYELFPQIKGHVIYTEVSTPLSTSHFTNYRSGEIYGLEHSPERFELDCLQPKTAIKGLYLTGTDIALVGIGGAIASGILCASTILKFGMRKQFRQMAKVNNFKTMDQL
jgi:all-trans-retinol 13,14-reductase